MFDLSTASVRSFKQQLQQAVLVCSERCLYNSTKWAAELLAGIRTDLIDLNPNFTGDDNNIATVAVNKTSYEASLPQLSEQEHNKYQYAKALFQMRQFQNVSYILAGCNAPKLRFLRLYAKYLSGEKRKEEETQDILGAAENWQVENAELDAIHDELRSANEKNELDAFCLYLYGMVLRKKRDYTKAAAILLKSVKEYEWNWSAWLEIEALVEEDKILDSLQDLLERDMNGSIMKTFFIARAYLGLHRPGQVFRKLMEPLTEYFPNCTYIKAQWATMFYEAMDYNEAEILFGSLRRMNPYRLEDMDVFSNVLYLLEAKEKLSVLAHQCALVDRYRPETCCIIDFNCRDYGAWHGLGQAYEMLKLPHNALYYFQKAVDLRPKDARMWKSLAGCFTLLQRDTEARDCYQKVLECDDLGKPSALMQLARIHEKMNEMDIAATYYREALDRLNEEGQSVEEIAEAGLFLARYALDKEQYQEAKEYASAVVNYQSEYHDEARYFLEEIKLRRSAA
ncbi:anaphase-promoting complex component apc8 [Apophysomyces ossiformis]|uniref:Anaphase-promoting complex component apc8 n=1 Tax=Apophysomyces ossiformis TaxID=679940 RepID=A0A8H7BR29_9FUNG|nr:anaphase-promoting complex component apc8 [Apophysomyces ossiformis]